MHRNSRKIFNTARLTCRISSTARSASIYAISVDWSGQHWRPSRRCCTSATHAQALASTASPISTWSGYPSSAYLLWSMIRSSNAGGADFLELPPPDPRERPPLEMFPSPGSQPERSTGNRRLTARYDLVALVPADTLVIYDWKTSRQRPERGQLEQHLQTRVYPYLLVRAGCHIHQGMPVMPGQVEMLYWFAGADEPMERFTYNDETFQSDKVYLQESGRNYRTARGGGILRTSDELHCRHCSYHPLCDR